MELYNNDFNDLSNTSINVKIKEIKIEYDILKEEIIKICDKLEILEN